MLSYHLISNPEILAELRKELETVMPDPNSPITWQQLERLPYLVSLLSSGCYGDLTAYRQQSSTKASESHRPSRHAFPESPQTKTSLTNNGPSLLAYVVSFYSLLHLTYPNGPCSSHRQTDALRADPSQHVLLLRPPRPDHLSLPGRIQSLTLDRRSSARRAAGEVPCPI